MEIRNLVAGSAVALAMVGTSMAGVALGGPISPVGVASADGCGSGTGAGGGVWCAPPNTPEQVLKAAHQDARGDLSDVGCQWPSCGPRWWPVKSPRPCSNLGRPTRYHEGRTPSRALDRFVM